MTDLADHAQQLIYDSRGWTEPNRGVAAASTWLDDFERGAEHGKWRIASDVNWRRLKTWRRLLTQGLDPATAPGILETIAEITIEHGPHAVTQAWQIAGWLARGSAGRTRRAGSGTTSRSPSSSALRTAG